MKEKQNRVVGILLLLVFFTLVVLNIANIEAKEVIALNKTEQVEVE